MVENRWQIVSGAVILLLMLLVGAFSLGVYVGEHGWTGSGLTYQPGPGVLPLAPQDQSQPPGQGQFQGQGADGPRLIGRILEITPQALDLATPDGRRRVELHEGTRYREENGAQLQFSDLAQGDVVAIFGEVIAGDGGKLLAQLVLRLPPRPPVGP
jgi:hypothetical protein